MSEKVTEPVGDATPLGGLKFRRAVTTTACPAAGCVGVKYKAVANDVDLVTVRAVPGHVTLS